MDKTIHKQQFRIIGVRPLKDCKPYISKVLQRERTYFFYNDYKETDNGYSVCPKETISKLGTEFFNLTNSNHKIPFITISAIVGKNGDGKSSLIELIIRIMNNFAVSVGYKEKHNDLEAIDGLHAILFYSIGEDIFKITIRENFVEFYDSISRKNHKWDTKYPLKKEAFTKIKGVEPLLFYTQVSNYSLYAFNSREFKDESPSTSCWLDGVFHKNDGYQTPIVLNPWRYEGIIDVNKENFLVKQRLLSLFTTDDNKNSFRRINHKQFAKNIRLIFAENKLHRKTFYEYFKNSRYTDYLYDEIMQVQNLDFLKTAFKSSEQELIMYLGELKRINKFINNIDKLIESHGLIFESAKECHFKMITDLPDEEQSLLHRKSDIEEYINAIYEFWGQYKLRARPKNSPLHSKDIAQKIEAEIRKLEILKNNTDCVAFNIKQLYRVVQTVFFRNKWVNCLEKFKQFEIVKDPKQRELIIDYLTYKSMSTIEKYPVLKENWYIDNPSTFLNLGGLSEQAINAYSKGFEDILKDIIKKKTHISLKIRQTLNFLYRGMYFDKMQIDKAKQTYTLDFTIYKKEIDKIKKTETEEITNRKILHGLLSLPIEPTELLPPPIFETEVEIEQIESGEMTDMSTLSSGERQYLNTISSVIYHLQNLSSVEDGNPDKIKYKHICLLMEEIELYFHPEMQTEFIKQLIQNIEKADVSTIDSIHICFVTHSPFILSDIPKSNVLFIKKGNPTYEMQENTFGANIHSLLKNGFFLDTIPIGEFAKEKINGMFYKLNNGQFTNEEYEKMYQDILIVGEPYLRKQLLLLYNSFRLPQTEYNREQLYLKTIASLEQRIELLEQKMKKND